MPDLHYEPQFDKMTVEIKLYRPDFGDAVNFSRQIIKKTVPFTLGPWTGKAYITDGPQVGRDTDLIYLEFELHLEPTERLTIAQTLVAFFDAEIVTNNGEPNV